MTAVAARRLAWGLLFLALAMATIGTVLVALNHSGLLEQAVFVLIFSGMAFSGTLIASRRPENAIGWLLIGFTMAIALAFVGSEAAIYSFERNTGADPGREMAGVGRRLGMGRRHRSDDHLRVPALPRRAPSVPSLAPGRLDHRRGHRRARRPVRPSTRNSRCRPVSRILWGSRRPVSRSGSRSGSGSCCSSCWRSSRSPRSSSGSDGRSATSGSRSSG